MIKTREGVSGNNAELTRIPISLGSAAKRGMVPETPGARAGYRPPIPKEVEPAADMVLKKAEEEGLAVKLIGGLAFKKICQSSREGSLSRNNNDIDLVVRRKDVAKLRRIMDGLGYEYPPASNVLHPDQILYVDRQNGRQVDIFVDGFRMCHSFDFRKGLEQQGQTLPITELVMTKLQIAEITHKDMQDLGAAFFDFRLGQVAGSIRYDQITCMTSRNWGIWKDFTDNLGKLKAWVGGAAPDKSAEIIKRADALLGDIEKSPKSARWKARAAVGERMQWHELPEKR